MNKKSITVKLLEDGSWTQTQSGMRIMSGESNSLAIRAEYPADYASMTKSVDFITADGRFIAYTENGTASTIDNVYPKITREGNAIIFELGSELMVAGILNVSFKAIKDSMTTKWANFYLKIEKSPIKEVKNSVIKSKTFDEVLEETSKLLNGESKYKKVTLTAQDNSVHTFVLVKQNSSPDSGNTEGGSGSESGGEGGLGGSENGGNSNPPQNNTTPNAGNQSKPSNSLYGYGNYNLSQYGYGYGYGYGDGFFGGGINVYGVTYWIIGEI